MYRSCIFCSAPLGSNESLERFPVGRSVAFDAAQGRLWAVCPRCARWNLAPIEERWEVVEDAERLFQGTRLRAHSENIGLAKLRDGTRLIRIGEALAGELAAWRYGAQLMRRRRHYLIGGAAAAAAALALMGGTAAIGLGIAGGAYWAMVASGIAEEQRMEDEVCRLPAHLSPTRTEVIIRRWHVHCATLQQADGDEVALRIPEVDREHVPPSRRGRLQYADRMEAVLRGTHARQVLGRAMVVINRAGASHDRVSHAVRLMGESASANEYLRQAAARGKLLGRGGWLPKQQLDPVEALAVEMALHDEEERRALNGELGALEAAWRQAEEIAAIADRLPHLPPPEPPRIGV